MAAKSDSGIKRREFLKLAGAATAASLAPFASAEAIGRVAVIVDAGDSTASSGPVKRAAERLQSALSAKNVKCEIVQDAGQARGAALCIAVAPTTSNLAKGFAKSASLTAAESIRLAPGRVGDTPAILISGIDQLGYVYGLLELAERAQFSADPMAALHLSEAIEEKPANEVRCVGRYFCSEVEDKPWYYDKTFWPGYLDALVASRFNRFNYSVGLSYNGTRNISGDYFHFPYPYLFDVPGYEGVRVVQLAQPDGPLLPNAIPLSKQEQEQNFEMLKYIATETGKRGLHFQLGIWTHAYVWQNSPNSNHRVEGMNPDMHATYCRDGLAKILKECPEIEGLTMRVHGESGIPEGSYPFWSKLFEAISGCGRKIEIDMHAKGVTPEMIDIAANTGMPVKLGAKYAAEHASLGYNQADIRALEIPDPKRVVSKAMAVSAGTRLFTRYGYGDFYQEGAKYKILYRLWPGTQRHLLSADPEMAAAYGRTSSFCGAAGLDICEPLAFKGRMGSGLAGGRCAYADESLTPKADWQKFELFYRVWGRKLYDPDAGPEGWRRYLRSEFGPAAAEPVETAVANASRVNPLVTSAHLTSASNNVYWPEMYTNQPIVLTDAPSPYWDTPDPKVFGTVSPLDPQIFSTIVEYTQDLLAGRPSAKYSPIEVAQWLEDYTTASTRALADARAKATSTTTAEFRRMEEDVMIQNALGVFFAAKLRAGVLYEIFQQGGDADAGQQALAQYKKARDAWAAMALRAKRVYRDDITYGYTPLLRGHWTDRLPAIDKDLAAMTKKLAEPPAASPNADGCGPAMEAAVGKPNRPADNCRHTPPESFKPGQPLNLAVEVAADTTSGAPVIARLFYRHVNQAERWASVEMKNEGSKYLAAIPADYTQSVYPLEYYFELTRGREAAWLHPAFNATLSNQPYYSISRRSA
jgi:hypothetical protein